MLRRRRGQRDVGDLGPVKARAGQPYRAYAKMWHAARAQEKKLRSMMIDHRKRAERRRAYYEAMVRSSRREHLSSLFASGQAPPTLPGCPCLPFPQYGDPTQMIRVVGTPARLHADAEQHFYHENAEHLYALASAPAPVPRAHLDADHGRPLRPSRTHQAGLAGQEGPADRPVRPRSSPCTAGLPAWGPHPLTRLSRERRQVRRAGLARDDPDGRGRRRRNGGAQGSIQGIRARGALPV